MAFIRTLVLAALLLFILPAVSAIPAACNDLSLDPSHVILHENQDGHTVSFTLDNDNSHTFEITDVRVQESNPHFNVSVVDFPDQINSGSFDRIRLNFQTEDVNGDVNGSFNLQVEGEYNGSNIECGFSDLTFGIDVTIEDGTNACTLIEASSNDVSIVEDASTDHSITVENNSNQDFTIQGFSIFEDSAAFSATLDPFFSNSDFEKVIPAHSSRTYNVDLEARRVDEDVTDTVFIEIRGEYSNGVDCASTEISGEFDVTVEDAGTSAVACADVTVNAPISTIVGGETSTHAFSLVNNSAQTFYVDEYTITDNNYQVSFNPLFTPENVHFQSSEELTYDATGYLNAGSFDSNAVLNLKGHFTSGNTCFISGKRIPFRFVGTNGGVCQEFYAGINPITILHGVPSMDVLFHNPMTVPATVTLTMDQGTVSPAHITLTGGQVQLITLAFSGVQNSTILHVNTSIPGCALTTQTSQVFFSGLDSAPVQFQNPPGVLTIGSANEFAIQIANQSAFTQDVTITVIAKPGNETFSRTVTVTGLDEPVIYLPAAMLRGKSAAVIQLKSAGYIVTRTIQLENGQAVSVIPVAENPDFGNTYKVNVIVQNNTNQTTEGDVTVDIPKGWKISGTTHTILAPYERKEMSFSVTPSVVLTDDRTLFATFTSPRNGSAPAPILFRANKNPISNVTAFVSSGNGIWLGLFVIFVFIAVWYAAKPKMEEVHGKTANVLATRKSIFVSSHEDELPEEPWMNPKKELKTKKVIDF